MASLFGHGIVGYTLAKVINTHNIKLLVSFAIVSAILPDIDVLSFKLGIPYPHSLGHRGFSHSILFALLWSILLMFTVGKRNKLLWFLVVFLSTVSHGVLDAMTSGGMGVGFFIPFNNNRFFFPFREILVSPLSIKAFFSEWGLQVVLSEFKYIFIPCLLVFVVRYLVNKIKTHPI